MTIAKMWGWALPICVVLIGMTACQESWQDRMVREAREATAKQCPMYLDNGLQLDSIVFVPEENARHNHLSFTGDRVDRSLITPENIAIAHRALVNDVRGSVEVMELKQHACTFHYHYHLQSDGSILYEDCVSAEEYEEYEEYKE